MDTTDKQHIANLVDAMVLNGINTVVISPGSRNAPLTIAFAAHPEVKHYLIHDERVAAFFAIGLSEGLGKPVAISCTSGSASLNYAPAIVEAYYRQIPILVLTADRPADLIDQGDGQCIQQNGIYRNFIKSAFVLPEENEVSYIDGARSVTDKALKSLTSSPTGPVHINLPLREPLYNLSAPRHGKEGYKIELTKEVLNPSDEKRNELLEIWQRTDKKLIIIGQLSDSKSIALLLEVVAQQNSVCVLVENTSNLQNYFLYNHSIDRSLMTISEDEIEAFRPDLILSFGGAIVSKKIKAFFRQNPPAHNWRLGNYLVDEDTFLSKTENILVEPSVFLKWIGDLDEVKFSNFGKRWKAKDFLAMEKHQHFMSEAPFSDLLVTDFILDTLPDHSILQMANSSVVRYCQLFNPIKGVRYYANRGVSGIDGSTSTAVGMAKALPNDLVTLITGDISFFYDSNGLWIADLPDNLRIFLINNNGGGIFNILEGSRKSAQNDLFVAPHKAKASSICEAFGVAYHYCGDIESLNEIIHDFYLMAQNNRPKLIEVDTSACPNHQVLLDYFEAIK